MKAPNGEPTNLTERQWLLVRTPSFKEWFGDWEIANAYNFAVKGKSVSDITGNEFQKDGVPLTEKVTAWYKSKYNGTTMNPELGKVNIDLESVKDSLGHGMEKEKAAAFAAVPDIIQKGIVYNRQTNWKNRGYDTYLIIAPITIGGEKYIGEVVVKSGKERQGMYLHEVEITKKTLAMCSRLPTAAHH